MELRPSRMFVNVSHFGRGFCGEYDLQSTQGQESPRFVRGLRRLIHRKAGHEEGHVVTKRDRLFMQTTSNRVRGGNRSGVGPDTRGVTGVPSSPDTRFPEPSTPSDAGASPGAGFFRGLTGGFRSPVYRTPVPDLDHKDDKHGVLNLIQDPLISLAQPVILFP
jgi:hypothetical protein